MEYNDNRTIIDVFEDSSYDNILRVLTNNFGGKWDFLNWNTIGNGNLCARIKIGG